MKGVLPYGLMLVLFGTVCRGLAAAEAPDRATDPAAALTLGKAALEDGLYDVARRALQDCLEQLGDKDRHAALGRDAAVALLRLWHETRQPDQMLREIRARRGQIHRYLHQPDMVFWTGMALFDQGTWVEVADTLKDFEQAFPDSPYVGESFRLRGWSLVKHGDLEGAIRMFERFDALNLGRPVDQDRNRLDWARALLDAGRKAEAREVLGRLVRQSAPRPEVFTGRYWLARLDVDDGQWEAAIKGLLPLMDQAEADPTLRAQAALLIGRAYEVARVPANALPILQRGLSLATEPALRREIGFALGLLTLETGDREPGIALLRTLIREDPSDPQAEQALLRLAGILLETSRWGEAETEYRHYLETYNQVQGLAQANQGRGWALMKLERYPEAATAFIKASRLHPDPVEQAMCVFKAADAYFANRQYQLAMSWYRQLERDYPDHRMMKRAVFQVGECLVAEGSMDAAESHFRSMVERYADDPVAEEAMIRIASLRLERGLFEEALAAYTAYQERYPSGALSAEAWYGHGFALLRLARYGEAIRDFNHLIQTFPSSRLIDRAEYHVSSCYFGMGMEREAQNRWEAFLQAHPKSAWVPDVVYAIAQHAFNQRRYDVAEQRFKEFGDQYPERPEAPEALYWAGMAAVRRQERVRAVELFARLVRDFPDSDVIDRARFAQGDALTELGRFGDAIVVFDEIIQKYPASPLVPYAWGRKGDCQFTLGTDNSARYRESMDSYRVVVNTGNAALDLVLQAEYKIGRCLEKLGHREDAVEHYYRRVVIRYLDESRQGVHHTEMGKTWLTRAAFSAADLLVAAGDTRAAVNILKRLVESGVPASEEAAERLRRMNHETVSGPVDR